MNSVPSLLCCLPKRALVRSFIFQLHFLYLTGQNEGSIPGVTISGVFIFVQRSVPGHSRPPRPSGIGLGPFYVFDILSFSISVQIPFQE